MHNGIKNATLPGVEQTIQKLLTEFGQITTNRRTLLQQLTDFISAKRISNEKILLNFICTHNSRRSHISQIWAQTAAHYYGVENVETYSGGTEATAFNPRAVNAMRNAGFEIITKKNGINPVYEVRFANNAAPITVFSKKYDDAFNPAKDFAAIMTCNHADENCPLVVGASARIGLTYNDPKDFDGTSQESEKYAERVMEIGREILFAFSQAK